MYTSFRVPCKSVLRPTVLNSIRHPVSYRAIGPPHILLLRGTPMCRKIALTLHAAKNHDGRYLSVGHRTQLVTAKWAASFDAAYSEFVAQVMDLLEQAQRNSARSVNAKHTEPRNRPPARIKYLFSTLPSLTLVRKLTCMPILANPAPHRPASPVQWPLLGSDERRTPAPLTARTDRRRPQP